MEQKMKPYTFKPNSASSSSLATNEDSHIISKFKPKIRIIHIIAPEIIQADVANFRELVQRLTGKPKDQRSSKKRTRTSSCKPRNELRRSKNRERIKEDEEEMWGSESSSNFFGGFADFDGFIQGLSEFSLHPLNASSHMDLYGEREFL